MAIFFLFSRLALCYQERKYEDHDRPPKLTSLLISESPNFRQRFNSDESSCNTQGKEYTNQNQFDFNHCSEIIFDNTIFNWTTNPRSVISIASVEKVTIQNCQFYSCTQASSEDLFLFTSTILETNNFTLDFSNLGNEIFFHSIFFLENSINNVSILSFNVTDLILGNSTPLNNGVILNAHNYLLHITNTQITNVKSNDKCSLIRYISNKESSIPLIIEKSTFSSINSAQFELDLFSQVFILDCTFHSFDFPFFNFSTEKEIQFRNTTFSNCNVSTSIFLDLSHWHFSDATFDNCTFNNISGRIISINKNSETVVFHSCQFNNNLYENIEIEGCPCINSIDGNLIVNDCQFNNNTNYGNGTSFYLINSRFVISDCVFVNNRCKFNNESHGGSICIFISDSSIERNEIHNCSFINNFCDNSGGSLYVNCTNSIINIENCNFNNCSSLKHGGALTSNNQFDLYLVNCTFKKCSSNLGGALYINENDSERQFIIDCVFLLNSNNGPSVYSLSNHISLSNSTFINNSLFIQTSNTSPIIEGCYFLNVTTIYIECETTFVMSNCTFDKTFFIIDASSIVTNFSIFDNCTFNNVQNGVILTDSIDTKTHHFVNCTFKNGISQDESGGINIVSTNSYVNILFCEFNNCQANNKGGALKCLQSKHVMIDSCSFRNSNAVNGCGGALFIQQDEDITIQNNIFESNHATAKGGSIFLNFQEELGFENEKIYVDNCTFINSICDQLGGAICSGNSFPSGESYNDGDLVIRNCKFINCAANKGGGLYFQNGQPESEPFHHDEEKFVIGCYFENCNGIQSNSLGTCIYSLSYKLEINTTIFKDNDDAESFLYIKMDDDGISPILNQNIFDNSARSMYIECKSVLNISNCVFENDYNFQLKSLFTLENLKTEGTIIDNCTFQTSNHGILAFSYQYDLHTIFHQCTIRNIDGGLYGSPGIRVGGNSRITISNCSFINLTCQNRGSAIRCENAVHCLIDGCNFMNNSAIRPDIDYQYDGYGGAIYVMQHHNITIRNNYFYNNTASYKGGGIFFQFQTSQEFDNEMMSIDNCTFINCASLHYGGALTCGSSSELDTMKDGDLAIINCKFIKCEAPFGGCIYFQNGAANEQKFLTNCYFESSNGTCISSQAYKIEINQTTFINEFDKQLMVIEMDEIEPKPIIKLCTFIYNSFNSFTIKILNELTFDSCAFRSYNKEDGSLVFDNRFNTTKLEFVNCSFNDFLSNTFSALIFNQSLIPLCEILNCSFDSLSAENGGAISLLSSNLILSISNTQFNDCSAVKYGGALFSNSNVMLTFTNCAFVNVQAGINGAALSIEMKNQIYLNSSFQFEKHENVSLIYLTGENNLIIDGGCFTSMNRKVDDDSPDFIFMDTDASIQFRSNPCFSESLEHSIYMRNPISIDETVFNCNECQPAPISPTKEPPTQTATKSPALTQTPTPLPTITIWPTLSPTPMPTETTLIPSKSSMPIHTTSISTQSSFPTPSATMTSVLTNTQNYTYVYSQSFPFSVSLMPCPTSTDDSATQTNGKRMVLIGIVSAICCLIAVLAIVLGIVLYCRKKANKNKFNIFVGESEDGNNDVVQRFINSQSENNQSSEIPLWSVEISTNESLIPKDDVNDLFANAFEDP